MNLEHEARACSTDNFEEFTSEIKDELDDEIFEIADANVRRQMSQMRTRKRSIATGSREPDDIDTSRSMSVSNFSVRRVSAISMADEEQEILKKVLIKRSESTTNKHEQAKSSSIAKSARKKPLNVRKFKISIIIANFDYFSKENHLYISIIMFWNFTFDNQYLRICCPFVVRDCSRYD